MPWLSAIVLIVLAAVVLAACGGGSSVTGPSSSTGGSTGSGSATLQGHVVNSQGAAAGQPGLVVALWTMLSPAVAEAVTGTPVVGATVNLLKGATVVATTTTDANGQFVFRDVAPGTYTFQVIVMGNPVPVAPPTAVTVGAEDQAIVGIATNGTSTVTVTAMSTDVFGNDAQLGHALNIADAAGSQCNLLKVTQLRETGFGWGEITQRCGVSASVIGLGRSNLSDNDLDDARQQNGRARVHGPSQAGGNGNDNGNGRSKGKGKGQS